MVAHVFIIIVLDDGREFLNGISRFFTKKGGRWSITGPLVVIRPFPVPWRGGGGNLVVRGVSPTVGLVTTFGFFAGWSTLSVVFLLMNGLNGSVLLVEGMPSFYRFFTCATACWWMKSPLLLSSISTLKGREERFRQKLLKSKKGGGGGNKRRTHIDMLVCHNDGQRLQAQDPHSTNAGYPRW